MAIWDRPSRLLLPTCYVTTSDAAIGVDPVQPALLAGGCLSVSAEVCTAPVLPRGEHDDLAAAVSDLGACYLA